MSNRLRITVKTVLIVSVISLGSSLSQTPAKPRSRRPTELALKIIPEKTIYGAREKFSADCEMTNLTDETLCFPPPTPCSFSISASRETSDGTGTGTGMAGGCGSGVYDAGPRDFLAELQKHWVKLPPNQTHRTSCLTGLEFSGTGKWNVYLLYEHVKLTARERALLQSAGYRSLETDVTSSAIQIEVVEEGPEAHTP